MKKNNKQHYLSYGHFSFVRNRTLPRNLYNTKDSEPFFPHFSCQEPGAPLSLPRSGTSRSPTGCCERRHSGPFGPQQAAKGISSVTFLTTRLSFSGSVDKASASSDNLFSNHSRSAH
jgi:hypothetical protein